MNSGSAFTEMIVRLARGLSNPALIFRRVLLLIPGLSFPLRTRLDLDERPHYLYGIHRAATQAKALGIPALAVVEFGVATGNGLLAMERIGAEVEAATGVSISVYGFDTGKGLPEPSDYRDLPYLYGGGFYTMDRGELERKLTRSKLVIGDVRDTVEPFIESLQDEVVGFVSHDLDYYSSTRDALKLFSAGSGKCLPRTLCYFDDIANADAIQAELTGQLLAISEFNESEPTAKISRVAGLEWERAIPARWNAQMFAFHDFAHPRYNDHVVEHAHQYVRPLHGT